MGMYRLAQMADLARQMQFTPAFQRARQLSAAEELLLQLDPDKGYPYDFVLFRITGYHAKPNGDHGEDGFTGQLLTGLALQHDLGLLIEQVSDGLNQCVEAAGQTVLTIEQVCQQFNVSDKSIQRWRRRGLAGRRFVFPDGKKRVGFLISSVERFFAVHNDSAVEAANFAPFDADELRRMTHSAARLTAEGCCGEEIAQRIGRRFNRSPLAVTHLLRQHAPGTLAAAAAPFSQHQRDFILGAFEQGESLSALAYHVGRPRSAVYRVLLEERLERLHRWNSKFFDDELYHQPEAASVIDAIASADDLGEAPTAEQRRLPKDLPASCQALFAQPLLTAAKERALFLKLNFHKSHFTALRRRLDGRRPRWSDLKEMEQQLQLAAQTKNRIIAANLRLVASVARRHMPIGGSLTELISDGSVTLMRAADGFDFHRGNRFSTYATLALMKEFARDAARHIGRRRDVALVSEMAEDPRPEIFRLDQRDQVRQLLSRLEDREQAILRAHFGLSGKPITYEQVGRELGLSIGRVRQIERDALAKLRAGADVNLKD
jgi:RNA polymerase primary sigma factor